jgi:hypothetical protein
MWDSRPASQTMTSHPERSEGSTADRFTVREARARGASLGYKIRAKHVPLYRRRLLPSADLCQPPPTSQIPLSPSFNDEYSSTSNVRITPPKLLNLNSETFPFVIHKSKLA